MPPLAAVLAVASAVPPFLAPPKIEFVGVPDQMVFRITNPNAKPLPFLGYNGRFDVPPTPAGKAKPLYRLETRAAVGGWAEDRRGWCGTGLGAAPIPARGTVTFDVWEWTGPGVEARIGVTWYPTADRELPATAWGYFTRKAADPK